ncbi:MlaA family lipoprotein [Polynucleobacter sphagniphilus]|jgi:phospholipid-binding lipoprotein MlaA|uniref:Phospholipid-binding lipoprotein MlaA n=1 Tax=Polynucleobacter sphagniphilus TaxID=1743169 RepID=A0AA43M8J5_9BURK|nr:VacJ family lipoprotein [Polynucleobacter sphagniphilus]MDF9789051.1 phospholipid-binding lipoprotein MlaA [Polynucleobacter sphagniphilus]MDH6249121.1 phospholipid-binding lipoprotein MlaA [Polynucleobacter sphagniphilus]MDH6299075.1 phospholipid-binding lipoprotein MlaA [Polynucleobacter sphagniphilus]MDH6302449.1 phospholipid-binding lipoprotein MlaA [Polynucleobacter sphagniphilus]MDH6504181.1 phospholipid-binding lipoprotein MlaA [Polynucleobacter sphagniphilus]
MSLLSAKLKQLILLGLASLLVACASIPAGVEPSPNDPWEPFNRSVFEFNEGLDAYLLKPVVAGYRFVLPEFVREGIYNFFSNYNDIYTALNNLLQGKPDYAASDLMRVVVNTTFGLGGLIDMATPGGLEKHKEDWGQTFGVWGVPSGPYVVLPFFGPSSVRDTFGTVADLESDYLFKYVKNIGVRNSVTGLRVVNTRNTYYEAGDLLDGAAIDKYSFMRDAYIQRREYQIHEGREDEEPLMPVYENGYE